MLRWTLVLALAALHVSAQQFQDQTAARLPAQAVWTEEVDAIDVDGDGDLDLLYGKGDGFSSAGTARQCTLLLNNGSGGFTDATAARLPVLLAHTKDIDGIDVDGDGDTDLVLANAWGAQPRIWLNNGLGFFTDGTATRFPSITLLSFSVAGADIDADGDIDLLFCNSGASQFGGAGGQPRLFINDGTGHFTDQTGTSLPTISLIAQVDCDFLDIDGDMDLDASITSRDGQSLLLVNDGAGHFVTASLPPEGSGTYEFEPGDVDNDGDVDIFVTGLSGLSEGVLVNNGSGSFTSSLASVVGNSGSDDNDANLGDIDNDGDLDVVVAALSTPERALVNAGGVFTQNSALFTSFTDSSMDGELADVDNDGDLDYVSAVGESGAFQNRVYINTTGPSDTRPPVVRLPAFGASTPFGTIPVRCAVRDILVTEGNPGYMVTLQGTVNGSPFTSPMKWAGFDIFQSSIPNVPQGAAVSFTVTAVDRRSNATTTNPTVFSPTSFPAPTLSIMNQGAGAFTVTLSAPGHPFAEELLFVSTVVSNPLGSGPLLGLGADAWFVVSLPPVLPPLHGYLDANGVQVTSFPPGSVPLGFSIDSRAVFLGPSPALSNIVRITF